MNKRIRELAKQAGLEMCGCGCDMPTRQSAKFAELIVKESLSVLKDMHLWQSVNNQNYPGVWHDAVDQSIDTIKEHFGVSE